MGDQAAGRCRTASAQDAQAAGANAVALASAQREPDGYPDALADAVRHADIVELEVSHGQVVDLAVPNDDAVKSSAGAPSLGAPQAQRAHQPTRYCSAKPLRDRICLHLFRGSLQLHESRAAVQSKRDRGHGVETDSQIGIYAINAVAEMTGIPTTTLRHWESTFGVVKPSRTEGGHRLYSQEDVERLRWLKGKIDEGIQPRAAHRLLQRELEKVGAIAGEADRRGAIMILVAERDPVTAELEHYFLTSEGYDVRIVLDGRKALEEAELLQPDLIIIDVILPNINGLKVCQALKSNPKTSAIPVLVFSVLDVRERSLRAGADAFLLKPLEQPALIELVKSMLAQKTGART
jgi:CheY-like chemotaxis protein